MIQPIDDPLFGDGDPLGGDAPPASINGHYSGKAAWKASEGLRIEDTDAWMLEHPSEARAILEGVDTMLGKRGEGERADIRFGTIPETRFLDPRRYGVGLAAITAHMGELRPGELVVVGAREGHGKTAIGEKMGLANAQDHKTLFVTLEMTPEEIRNRMLAKKLNCSLDQLEREQGEATGRYKAARSLVSSYDLLVWQPAKKERRIEAITQRAVDTSTAVLIIDYTRRIGGWKPGDTAGEIMDYLSEFVRASSITTILLAQLNRDAAGRRPSNAHFQDTGKLEQAADRCILLHRPFLGQPAKDDIVEITVSKNRQGPCFRAHAFWHGPTMNFSSMDELDEQNAACCRGKKRKGDDDD